MRQVSGGQDSSETVVVAKYATPGSEVLLPDPRVLLFIIYKYVELIDSPTGLSPFFWRRWLAISVRHTHNLTFLEA